MTSVLTTQAPSLSVVLPLHRTREALPELIGRLRRACPRDTELVFVDDSCPQGSGQEVLSRWSHVPGRLVLLHRQVGQHTAVQAGLRATRGNLVVVMDADLQDAPEDVPVLLAALAGAEMVCAGRRGHYSAAGRERTARTYRRLVWLLSRGQVPADAGMFSVLTRAGVDRVIALADHGAPLVPCAARAGLRISSVPVTRWTRPGGRSATTSWRRIRIAARGLATLTPLHPILRRVSPLRRKPPMLEVCELGPVPSSTPPREEP
jgi:dolichol-phosphate mannosyltransferase